MNHQVSGFDYNKLREEAQTRWLKPAEILFILQNHGRYPITLEAPKKPPSGSLFLFNRRVLRFFRKDGHMWRKKKDGRTVGEAHERLKVGNVDALNCYYAHGEPNPYFQRRSFWMLDPAYEHIVLVHYREVSEGRFLFGSISNLSTDSCSTFSQSTGVSNVRSLGITSGTGDLHEPNGYSCSPGSVEEVSSELVIEKFETNHLNTLEGNFERSPQPEVNQALRKLAEQLSLDDDDNTIYFGEKLPAYCSEYVRSQDLELPDYETRESLEKSHENIPHGLEYWEHSQIESGKQDGHSSTQLLKVSGDNGKQGSQSLGSGHSIGRTQYPSWDDMLELSSSSAGINAHEQTLNLLVPEGVPWSSSSRTSAPKTHFLARSMLKHDGLLSSSERAKISVIPFEQSEQFAWQQLDHGGNNAEDQPNRYQIPDSDLSLQLSATRRFLLGPDNPIEPLTAISQLPEVETQYISGTSNCEANCNVVKLSIDNSTDWMGTTDLAFAKTTYSSDFSGMWFDQGQFGIPPGADSSLTVAQKQRFSIREISPEWAFSFESTKVIITGEFLSNPSEFPWAVMFGDVEVPIEIVQEGVLRCQAPQHEAGNVTLCITSGNRESCSEVREFEFRAKPTTTSFVGTPRQADATNGAEELLLLVRLVHMLLYRSDGLSTLKGGVEAETGHSAKSKATEDRWSQITEALLVGCEIPSGTKDWIMQELLKDKLQQWLSSKSQGKEDGGCFLSKQEQGIIHMISCLGFEWALNPILDSGVGINFRDAKGWTALHWAAYFGREEMVAALLAAGASAGAVTDPTPQDPVGKTAGAIAAARGHRGLAGYLSEADLTSHLSSITVEKNEISKGSAEVEAARAVESISQRSVQMHVGGTEDELSLKDSLAAVRNAAQSAARIQAAFRAHSFRRRQQKAATSRDYYGMTPEDIHGLSASSKFQRAIHGPRDQKFDKAALSIQKKYRGWKGRKDFLTLRQHVVKIQAYVRGHQERKKYKEFVWTVSVVEKVILRWRRRGVGLRGYRAEQELIVEGKEEEEEDIVKVFRKQKVDAAVDQAVSRVLSMVDSPNARQQYRRMLERYRQAKAELSTSDEAKSRLQDDFEIIESDGFMY